MEDLKDKFTRKQVLQLIQDTLDLSRKKQSKMDKRFIDGFSGCCESLKQIFENIKVNQP